jgi:hypothetical protein
MKALLSYLFRPFDYRVIEESQEGHRTFFYPESRMPIWPFWMRSDVYTPSEGVFCNAFSDLASAEAFIAADKQEHAPVKRRVHNVK